MSNETFLAKLEKNNTRKYLLPILQEEITYKKMDVIESSVNKSLPNFLASKVLNAMKKTVAGEKIEEEKIDLNDDDIKDMLVRATEMWSKLVKEPSLSMEQIVEIPSEDRLAWFMNAIAESQEARTQGGGVVNAAEISDFPDKTRNRGNSKRSTNS